MTQLANIVVKNAANVDASFNAFQPQSGSDPALWLYSPTAGAPRSAQWRLSLATRLTQNKAQKSILILSCPVLDATGALQFTVPVRMEFSFPRDITDAQALDIFTIAKNILANAVISDSVSKSSPVI